MPEFDTSVLGHALFPVCARLREVLETALDTLRKDFSQFEVVDGEEGDHGDVGYYAPGENGALLFTLHVYGGDTDDLTRTPEGAQWLSTVIANALVPADPVDRMGRFLQIAGLSGAYLSVMMRRAGLNATVRHLVQEDVFDLPHSVAFAKQLYHSGMLRSDSPLWGVLKETIPARGDQIDNLREACAELP